MSAYMVDKEHIDVIVTAARQACLRNRGPIHWYPAPLTGEEDWRSLSDSARSLSYSEGADEVGQLLVSENVRSVTYRYPGTQENMTELPGPCNAYWLFPYRYCDPGFQPTAVEALQALSGYEYQACEHPGWHKSEAKCFVDVLRAHLINALPGINDTPWNWTAEAVAGRRGNVVRIV